MTQSESESIVRELWIDAAPEDVFPYFTEADKLKTWKAVWAESEGRTGGGFHVDVTGKGEDVAHGVFLEVEPPRRVVFTWEWDRADDAQLGPPSTVEVTLTVQDGGTLLRLVHRGLPALQRGGSAEGWTHYLARLQIVAAGEDPGPDPWAATAPPRQPRSDALEPQPEVGG